MLFNSFQFALFLPAVFFIYWLCPSKQRWIVLLVSSYYFYMSWNVKYVVLILLTTAVSYFAALFIGRTDDKRVRKRILAGALAICLGVLFIFKYLNFFFDSLSAVLSVFSVKLSPMTLKLLLPVGISFYTFQTLSYVIDVYKGAKPEKHFGIYATFVAFFPQLVAGPIERSSNLMPQLKEDHTFNYGQAAYGIKLIAWGLAKKMVVADNLAVYVDKVYSDVHGFTGFPLVLASVFFAVQIYCDFSAYSDIARGSAKLLGIELMVNFDSPYFSTSVREFWSRWHISLSTWLRDYVYIPLGGNRVSRLRNYLNLMITFLVSGLWHGASWTYVIWGGIHGAAQVAEKALGVRSEKKPFTLRWFLRAAALFILVTAAWVFFRAQSLSDAGYVFANALSGITSPGAYFSQGLLAMSINKTSKLLRIVIWLLPLIAFDCASVKTDVISWISGRKPILRYAFYFGTVLYVMLFHAFDEVEFVYFQF